MKRKNNQVSTNIGKAFFHLLRKHFSPNHRLYKICNKNIIKLGYSCTPNMGNIIAAQNKKLINQHDSPSKTQPCDCRNTDSCPLSGNNRVLERRTIFQLDAKSYKLYIFNSIAKVRTQQQKQAWHIY